MKMHTDVYRCIQMRNEHIQMHNRSIESTAIRDANKQAQNSEYTKQAGKQTIKHSQRAKFSRVKLGFILTEFVSLPCPV